MWGVWDLACVSQKRGGEGPTDQGCQPHFPQGHIGLAAAFKGPNTELRALPLVTWTQS